MLYRKRYLITYLLGFSKDDRKLNKNKARYVDMFLTYIVYFIVDIDLAKYSYIFTLFIKLKRLVYNINMRLLILFTFSSYYMYKFVRISIL